MNLRTRRRRGVALLLSLAILAVLAILATTFTRLMIMEHSASNNYVAATRAGALAEAGLEYALGKLRHLTRDVHWSNFGTRPQAQSTWLYKMRIDDGGPLQYELGAGLPIEHAGRPALGGTKVHGLVSWYKGDTGTKSGADLIVLNYPLTEQVDVYNAEMESNGTGRQVSGWIGSGSATSKHLGPYARFVAGTFENWGDTFALKTLDCASQVNINMQTAHIKPFLNHLGEEIDNYFRFRFNAAGVPVGRSSAELGQMGYKYPGMMIGTDAPKLGDWLIPIRDGMPGKFFQSKEELLTLIKDRMDKKYPSGTGTPSGASAALRTDEIAIEEYNKLADFITLYSWRDRTVLEPGTLMTAEQYEVASAADRWKEARSPINMNTASQPVMTAWLRGISYFKYSDGITNSTSPLEVKFASKPIDHLRRVANKLRKLTYYDPLMAWKGVESMLDSAKTPESGGGGVDGTAGGYLSEFRSEISGWDKWDRDAFLAMADPNTTLNKFNPDFPVKRHVDKYDLSSWTTELCFNSGGYYEITSLGTITHLGGQVLSQRKIRGVYQIWDMVYKTTQRDFELSRQKNGVDVQSGASIRLHDEGFWGVISYPEYRQKFLEYAETTTLDSADDKKYGYVALYDGMLSFNALTREDSYDDDFLAGFNYPLYHNIDSPSKNELDGLKPQGSKSAYQRHSSNSRSVVSDSGPRLAMTVGANSDKPTPATRLNRFTMGSDGFPLGYYTDHLRKRYLAYDGDVVKEGLVGAVEFWVKPNYEVSVGKESWWYWEDQKGQKIWCYREGTVVVTWFSIGNIGDGTLRFDASGWKAGSWHHLHIDWGDTGRVYIDGLEMDTGGIKGTDEDTTSDGSETKGHPAARHMDFGGWPPKTQAKMQIWTMDPGLYSAQITWIEGHIPKKPGKYDIPGTHPMWVLYGTDQEFMPGPGLIPPDSGPGGPDVDDDGGPIKLPPIFFDSVKAAAGVTPKPAPPSGTKASGPHFGNATIDNLVITTWRIFVPSTTSFSKAQVPFRYFPREYRGYSRMYWQDITDEFSAYKRDMHLGTLAWTNYHGFDGFIKVYLQIGGAAAKEAPGG